MAKLPQEVAKTASEAETGYALMEENDYELELLEVQTEKNGQPLAGPKGSYWVAVFQVPEDAERYKKRRFWVTLSHSDKAAPILNKFFAAFGASTDTDTDELVGRRVLGHVGVKVIDQGARASQKDNEIQYLMPLEGAKSPVGKGKEKVSKDMF